ncbi:MAG: LptA/OstA family protein [Candidatus Margulisbacteria bacterium]|nr:LptA/OstA family protein [Candidatus Margulisiibacteriota bacterium]
MEENLSWKIVFFGTIFSLLVLAGIYFMIAPQGMEYFTENSSEKIAEFKNTRIIGKKDGKPRWEFAAEKGWTAKDKETTYLTKISDGKFFHNEKAILHSLFAPRAKAYLRFNIIEVFGLPENANPKHASRLSAKMDMGNIANPDVNKPEDWATLTADYLKYFSNDKRTEIKGRIRIAKKDSSICADQINLDNESKIADVSQNVKLTRSDGILKADTMRYFGKEKRMEANGNVRIAINEKNKKTIIKAGSADFFIDVAQDMALHGKVEASQAHKLAVGNDGVYSQKNKNLQLTGAVKAVFVKAGVILKPDTANKLQNKEARDILQEKTVLTADELSIATQSGDARARGSVLVTQKGREARADSAFYDDKDEMLTLTGNVSMKRGEQWVRAKRILVSVKNETFEAEGKVEAKFKI